MGAETLYYVKVPVVGYRWEKVYALTEVEAKLIIPQAIEIQHWSEFEKGEQSE
jgi:hypothetical protein